MYVNKRSNHSSNVIEQIPIGIEHILPRNSSSIEIFEIKKEYKIALGNEGHKTTLVYKGKKERKETGGGTSSGSHNHVKWW